MARARRFLIPLGGAIGIVVGLWLLYVATERYENVGTMGEWIGGLGALLAVLIAVSTFRRQRELDLADRAAERAERAEEARRQALLELRVLAYTALIAHDEGRPFEHDTAGRLVTAAIYAPGNLMGATEAVGIVHDMDLARALEVREREGRLKREDKFRLDATRVSARRYLVALIHDVCDMLGEDSRVWDRLPDETA